MTGRAIRFNAGVLLLFCAVLVASCSGRRKDAGGYGSPGPLKEIKPEEYGRLVAGPQPPGKSSETAAPPEGKRRFREAGELSGSGDKDDFVVVAAHKEVDVTFEWPRGKADFWVKVYGKDENELGDFDLDDGEVIQLLGGGRFRVEIRARGGAGLWAATYDD